MNAPDPRLTLARADLADQALEGLVASARYAATRRLTVAAPSASLVRTASPDAERLDELLRGETFDALEAAGDYVWGQARRDGYVGFVRADALAPVPALRDVVPESRRRAYGDTQPPRRPDPGQRVTGTWNHGSFWIMLFSQCGAEQLLGARCDAERDRVPEPGELVHLVHGWDSSSEAAGLVPPRVWRSLLRARLIRDRTVPTGIPSAVAASW